MDEKAIKEKLHREQIRVAYNEPSELEINGKTFKVRPITGAVADKMSGYIVKQVDVNTPPQGPELIAKQSPNAKLQAKAVTLALLNDPRWGGFLGWLKVNLFFRVYWRKIFWSFSPNDISMVLNHIIDKLGLVFFFENMISTKGLNTLEKKMTKKEVESLSVEQESEKKQDS